MIEAFVCNVVILSGAVIAFAFAAIMVRVVWAVFTE